MSIAFFVPGDDASIASLRRHVGALDWVVPATVSVAGPNHAVTMHRDIRFDRMIAAMPHPPKVLPMVQNLTATQWDGAGALLGGVSLLCLCLGLASSCVAWRSWRKTRHEAVREAGGPVIEVGEGRTGFLALLGLMAGFIFNVAIVVTGCAVLLVQPCRPWFQDVATQDDQHTQHAHHRAWQP